MIGLNEERENRMIDEGKRMKGKVDENILGREEKVEKMVEIEERVGIKKEEDIEVGDGEKDMGMIKIEGKGVEIKEKKEVEEKEKMRIENGEIKEIIYIKG